jgi:hypothetical protein
MHAQTEGLKANGRPGCKRTVLKCHISRLEGVDVTYKRDIKEIKQYIRQ